MTVQEWMEKEDVLTASGYDTDGKIIVMLTHDEFADIYFDSGQFQKFCEKAIDLPEEKAMEALPAALPPLDSDPLWARIKRTVGIADADTKAE